MEDVKKAQKILILGYGLEGQSVHKFINFNFPNKEIFIADKESISADYPVKKIYSGENYLSELETCDLIIRSPGVPSGHLELKKAISKGIKATSSTNIFFAISPGTKIGITGTKGKSTTSALITHILKQEKEDVRLVGNIGNPPLDNLDAANKETLYVIELSSYQLEDLNYSPHIAVILNIFPEHLDRYISFEDYAGAKKNIVKYQQERDYVVFNPLNKTSRQLAEESLGKKVAYSKELMRDVINENELPLIGPGNLENVQAAIAVAKLLGVSKESMAMSIKTFKPLEHRLEYIGEYYGIKFYNDSLATNPQATINALEALPDTETLIAGGYDRGLDYKELGRAIIKSKVKHLILFPTTGEKINEAIELIRNGKVISSYPVDSMEKAIKIAFEQTSSGETCLLSPGSPSFGIFENYKERGDLFKKLVIEYKK